MVSRSPQNCVWCPRNRGSGTANCHGTAMFTVYYVVTGGTGLFAGDTGHATLKATVTRTSPTTGSATRSYVVSLAPEPSTLALLAPAAAVGPVVVIRGRPRETGLRLV